MDRVFDIQRMLNAIGEQLDDILNTPEYNNLSPEECIQLALELTLNEESNTREYSPLVAEIKKETVNFYLGDNFEVPLYGNDIYLGEDDDED